MVYWKEFDNTNSPPLLVLFPTSFVQVPGESHSQIETQEHSEQPPEEELQEQEEYEQPGISEELTQPKNIMSNPPIV